VRTVGSNSSAGRPPPTPPPQTHQPTNPQHQREAALLLSLELLLCLTLGPLVALPLRTAAAMGALIELARREPEDNAGHRAGAEGFDGEGCIFAAATGSGAAFACGVTGLLGQQSRAYLSAAAPDIPHTPIRRTPTPAHNPPTNHQPTDQGPHPENSLSALAALLARDNHPRHGPLPHLRYVEFDVQETADGHVVVLHDQLVLPRSFPPVRPNVGPLTELGILGAGGGGGEGAAATPLSASHQAAEDSRNGRDNTKTTNDGSSGNGSSNRHSGGAKSGSSSARPPAPAVRGNRAVSQLTLAELRSLHLGGREGERVPTLREFLAACREGQCRRSVLIEVKALRSEGAKRELVEAIRWWWGGVGWWGLGWGWWLGGWVVGWLGRGGC